MNEREPRIAIVSDPLVQRGGAERVVEAMARTFPEAPIYALLYSHQTGPSSLRGRVVTSPLGRIPGAALRHRLLLPFYPAAIESFDLGDFDIIVSSHHTVAKGLIRSARSVHVCYCHTPMRALWERPREELATLPPLFRPAAASLFRKLRVWDIASLPRVDFFLANSRTTQQRIRKHYGRDSQIVYPPIDIDRFTPNGEAPGDYYLVASRLVPYKRVEVAFEAARIAGRRLVIVGEGPGRAALSARGAELRGHVSDPELIELMRGARALIFPQVEDLGMTPLEMMACGRPVIAFGDGGATETVLDGQTGLLVDEQTPQAFAEAIRRFESIEFTPQACRSWAEQFSPERFQTSLRAAVSAAAATVGYDREASGGKVSRRAPRTPARPPRRVLQVMEATLGGTRRYLEDVSEALGKGNHNGLVYSLYRADGAFLKLLESLRRAGWDLFELDMRREIDPLRDLACARNLREIYRRFRPDVIHAHSSKAGGLVRIATVGMKNRPRIVYTPNSIASNVSWFYGQLEKLLALRLDIIVAVTESERDELHALKLIPLERIRVAVPTVASDVFSPRSREAARSELGIGSGPVVIAIGRLTAQKDPLAFVNLAALLRKRIPDVHLFWVGDGELRPAVEARIAALDLGSTVSITGWLEDVRPYVAAADVFVSTSRYESFGYVTAEACAMERPVVASKITGTIDVVRYNVDEQLFPLDDIEAACARVVRLLNDPELAAEVAGRDRAYVNAAFSSEETRKGLHAAYDAALQTSA